MKEYTKGSIMKRQIPLAIKFRILFGGTTMIIGLVFFVIGSLFMLIFGQAVDWKQANFNKAVTGEGVIDYVSSTNSSVNEETVMAFYYDYEYNGQKYRGVSYSEELYFQEGQVVPILIVPDSPEDSKIKGMRTSTFAFYIILFIAIFPLIGFLFMFFHLKRAFKQIGILGKGIVTFGTLVNKEATNTSINEQTVYKLFFEFTAENGQIYKAIGKTHQTYKLEDEGQEKLVYDPRKPEDAVMVDELPEAVKRFFEQEG